MSSFEDRLDKIEQGEENPFWTVEALGEHIGSLRNAVSRNDPKSIEYHIKAIEDARGRLFQMMALLLPELYESSEGERTPALPPDAYERYRAHLQHIGAE